MTAPPAPDAESLSCAIAGRYAGRWARSIGRLQAEDDDAPGLAASWFVDVFAGADLQRAALRAAPVQPAAVAAVAAVQALGAATRVVLIEEDPGLIARLRDALAGIGAGDRVRADADPADAEPGEIVIVEAPFTRIGASLARRIGGEPALVRLAPLAARSLPWNALEPFARLAAADVLLRVPLEDFGKQARFTGPLADLPPHIRRVVEGCSALLDDPRHGWISAWRQAWRAGGDDAAFGIIVERMQALLAGVDEERTTRALAVAGSGTSVHLLLSTPHAAHALELDGASEEREAAPKPKKRSPRAAAAAQPEPTTATEPVDEPAEAPAAPAPAASAAEPPAPAPSAPVLELFTLSPQPEPPRTPDLAAVADELHARHVGAKVPVPELLAGLADSELTPEEVQGALALLKRAGRAAYRSLDAESAEVEFLAEPRLSTPRPRKPRKPAPGELGLFDEPEG